MSKISYANYLNVIVTESKRDLFCFLTTESYESYIDKYSMSYYANYF